MAMLECLDCKKKVEEYDSYQGRCGKCHAISLEASARGVSVEELHKSREKFYTAKKNKTEVTSVAQTRPKSILTTTESCHNLPVKKRISVISTEVAVGMNVFKDFFIGVRNFVGGRSTTTQNAIRDMRRQAYMDLKTQAHSLNANAVVAISESYLEIGNSGSTMLLLVVTGTAVEIEM